MGVYLGDTTIVGGGGGGSGMSLGEWLNMAKTCGSYHRTEFSYTTNCGTMKCPIIVCGYGYISGNVAGYGSSCYAGLKVNGVQIMNYITKTAGCDYGFPVAPGDCIEGTNYGGSNYTHHIGELIEYY